MRFGRLEPFIGTLRFRLTFWNTLGILVLVLVAFVGVRQRDTSTAFLAS